MAFPYADYGSLVAYLMPAGSTLSWKGDPEPFYTPIGDTPIVTKLDTGTVRGNGTSENRRIWIPEAANGDGAWATYVLERVTWTVTIEVETFDADNLGDKFIMELRGKLRWPTTMAKIQDMGLSTIRIGDIRPIGRTIDEHETFVAVLEVWHGQCFVSEATDDDGNVINTAVIMGVLTGGKPDPLTLPDLVVATS